jgi:hypothetical protein
MDGGRSLARDEARTSFEPGRARPLHPEPSSRRLTGCVSFRAPHRETNRSSFGAEDRTLEPRAAHPLQSSTRISIARVFDAIGILSALIALWHTLVDVWLPIQYYDEGILLTDAQLLLHGQVPYRDFYSNYPPGIFALIAGLWRITGVSVLAYRLLGVALHVCVGALAGRVAGRVSGRRFVWLAAGLTWAWLERLEASPSAYLAALALGLAFAELCVCAREHDDAQVDSRARWALAGLAFGASGCFRHDLFVYLTAALVVAAAIAAWRRELVLPRAARWFAAGTAVPLLALWLPTFLGAGVQHVTSDLFLDQVRYVMPARVLPLPSLLEAKPLGASGIALPACAVDLLAAGVLLALIAPLSGGLALTSARYRRLPIVLLESLSLAVLPQMLGRTDPQHTLYAVTPGIILLCGLSDAGIARTASAPRRAAWTHAALYALPLALAAAWLALAAREALWPVRAWPAPVSAAATLPRYFPLPSEHLEERRAALAFIAAHTSAGDPIFVGLWSHRRAMGNDLDLYFLADRTGATRYMQFDPNVVTRPDVQEEMIAELERTKPRAGILTSLEIWYEPNQSNRLGSPLLDEYLHANYRLVETVGTYRMILRK